MAQAVGRLDLRQLQGHLKQELIARNMEEVALLMERSDLQKARERLVQVLRIDQQNTKANQLLREVQLRIQKEELQVQVGRLRDRAAEALAHEQFQVAQEALDRGLALDKNNTDLQRLREEVRQAMARAEKLHSALKAAETAHAQVTALGFRPEDVRHIVTTHLDLDHSGGLPDFPEAQVHLLGKELAAALSPDWRSKTRYIPAHWLHVPRWVEHETGGDEWMGFGAVRILPGSGGEILLIPLPGHTLGHTGVAIRRGDGWLLHCGDAYFFHGEVDTPPHCPPGLRLFQNLNQTDGKQRRENQERLRELAARHGDEVELICSHDPVLLERAQAAAAPAAAG